MSVDKGEFTDYVVLVASTRKAAEAGGRAYVRVARMLGLTVDLPKIKFIVVGFGVTDDNRLLMPLEDGGTVKCVSQFPYLGSLIPESGRSHEEMDRRIANASKPFWALR